MTIRMEEGQKYADYLTEINDRLKISALAEKDARFDVRSRAEIMAMQVRKVIEMVVFFSLIANRSEYEKVQANFARHRIMTGPGGILSAIEKLNPNFLPVPITLLGPPEPEGQAYVEETVGEFLTKERIEKIFVDCSEMIHVPNPYRTDALSVDDFMIRLPKYRKMIVDTLLTHKLVPTGGHVSYFGFLMGGAGGGGAVYLMRPSQ
jgi:hypothetical protein